MRSYQSFLGGRGVQAVTLGVAFWFFLPISAGGHQSGLQPDPTSPETEAAGIGFARQRIIAAPTVDLPPSEASALQSFLEDHRSPMAPYALEIVEAAERHEVDWRLIVAIAGVESTFGKNCAGFNAWGWNNGGTRWPSWSASIEGFTGSFASKYPDRTNIAAFARRYNPVTPSAWSRKVTFFISEIESSS